MAVNQECLYMQYFYNAVIEFIYFTLLYIESFGKTSVNTLCKHVKFFKVEVGTFILSFHGETFEDKLCQMLKTIGYFSILEDKVCISKNKSFKGVIFNDLVISKCADLVLRGIDNIDAISENLNFNNVIYISKKTILDIIEKSSYFSTKNKKIVLLHHIHGLLGFEDDVSNSVICYFYDLLYRNKALSFNQVREHSKYLSFCGIHNVIMIFSILNCSKQFDCENGYICLKEKSKKYPKLKTIDLEQEGRFSSRSMPVGEIVQSVYGSSIYKWTGEIGSLNEYSGMIYCVVDFKNSYHGVFNICFNETALKIISDTKNLKKYLKIRDIVEFDAKYYNGKNSERCWSASRLKVLHNSKFEHDENLYNKLSLKSELLKNQCSNNNYCFINSNFTWDNFISDNCLDIENPKYNCEEKLAPKILKTFSNKFYKTNDSINKLEGMCENGIKNCITHQKPTNDLQLSFSNLSIVDYSYMFGYIYMLMADKGMAIAEQGDENYNIVFTKDSVYPPVKFENLINGQKVLVLIPHQGTLESFCVSTLVYGLNKNETYETENNNVLPKDFAMKVLADSVAEKLKCKFCNNYNSLHRFVSKEEGFITTLKQRIELIELYESILRDYKVLYQNDYLLRLLFGLHKINLEENLSKKFFHFIAQISNYIKKYTTHKLRKKSEKKLKMVKNCENNYNLQLEDEMNDLCIGISQLSFTDQKCVSPESFSTEESNLDAAAQSSTETLNSFESCYSSDSNEKFYSCETSFSSPDISSSSLLDEQGMSENLHDKTINFNLGQGQQIQTQSYEKISHLLSESNQNFSLKLQSKNLKQKRQYKNHYKYLCYKSLSFLKHSGKKKRRIVFPTILKSVCKNCFKSSVSLAAYISMISKSFFFYTLNINDCNIILPLPKQVVPPDMQGNMKLNSCSKLTVIPNVLANLSHIIVVNVLA